MKTRLGILGGTFNPIHLAHLVLAQTAAETHDLGRVLFVPCAVPPHKDAHSLIDTSHRVAMLELALEDDLRFEISDVDLTRQGASYSVDTIRALVRQHPHSDLYFIIGSDTLLELHSWRNIEELLDLCTFVTFGRPGADVATIREEDLKLPPPWPQRLLANCSSGRQVDVSSSDIRHRIKEGLSIRYLVPQAVEIYIAEHGLYLAQ
jgi:nicotinate-nucleotide adenylyltransferase